MPKLQTNTNNFTAGEFSPRLRGRVDLEKFNSSAEKLENCVVLRQGGATIRPSRDWKGEIKTSTQTARIVPFVYSRVDAYVLELGNLYMRVWKNGAQVEASPGVPYEVTTPWTQAQLANLDFTQGADTLIVTHPDVQVQRVRRFADNLWLVEDAPFDPPALYEVGLRDAGVNLTISSVAIGAGRTITASGAVFLNADVGRRVTWGAGSALITGYTSTTVVTATVTAPFPTLAVNGPNWVLEDSIQTNLQFSGVTPVGANPNMTISVAGWRAADVGKFVEAAGGIVEIVSITSTTVAVGRIVTSPNIGLVSGVPEVAYTGTWTVKGSAWNSFDGYPSSCTLHQQRLWLGGTSKFPQTKWGSRSGLSFDFTPGTDDDSAVYKTMDSDDVNIIQFLCSTAQLVTLTYGGEFETKGGVEKPITQTNAQITRRSKWGAERVRPEDTGADLLFVQRGGTVLRALVKNDIEGFNTNDISVFSEHLLTDGIKSMTWEQAPEQVLWMSTQAGDLLAVTYNAEQNLVAFCSGSAEGSVEWLATVPEGAIDATYALVRYTVGGVTRRYVERLNWSAPPGQDGRREFTGAAASVWAGFSHLEGKTLAVLADDIYVGTAVVASGQITLPRTATKVSAGLPYTARLRLQAPETGTGSGTAQAQAQATNKVWVRLLETIGCKVNGEEIAFRQFGDGILDQPVAPFTGIKEVSELGWQDGDSPIEITQDQPYPWTVLAAIRNFTVNPS